MSFTVTGFAAESPFPFARNLNVKTPAEAAGAAEKTAAGREAPAVDAFAGIQDSVSISGEAHEAFRANLSGTLRTSVSAGNMRSVEQQREETSEPTDPEDIEQKIEEMQEKIREAEQKLQSIQTARTGSSAGAAVTLPPSDASAAAAPDPAAETGPRDGDGAAADNAETSPEEEAARQEVRLYQLQLMQLTQQLMMATAKTA